MSQQEQPRKLIFISFLVLVFLKSSVSYLLITSFPVIEVIFNLNHTQLGLIISIFYLFSLIFTFVWIYLIERKSYIKTTLTGTLIWISGCILISVSPNYFFLLLASAILGIGIECSTIAALIYILNFTSMHNEGKAFSFYISIQGVGSLLGIFLTSFFYQTLQLAWSFVFLFIGVLSAIVLIIIYILIKVQKVSALNIKFNFEEVGYKFNFKSFGVALKKKTNLGMFIVMLCITPFFMLFNVWLQKYFQEIHNLSQMESVISYIFLSGGEFIGMILGGYLIDKFHSKENYKKIFVVCLSLIISGPLLLIGFMIPWVTTNSASNTDLLNLSWNLLIESISNPLILLAYVSLFFGLMTFAPIYIFFYVLVNDCNSKSEKSAALGVINFAIIIGELIGPILGGIIADFSSLTFVLILPSFLLIFTSVYLYLMRKVIYEDFKQVQQNSN